MSQRCASVSNVENVMFYDKFYIGRHFSSKGAPKFDVFHANFEPSSFITIIPRKNNIWMPKTQGKRCSKFWGPMAGGGAPVYVTLASAFRPQYVILLRRPPVLSPLLLREGHLLSFVAAQPCGDRLAVKFFHNLVPQHFLETFPCLFHTPASSAVHTYRRAPRPPHCLCTAIPTEC